MQTAQDASEEPADKPAKESSRPAQWARRTAAAVPTKFFGTITLVLFLAVTAAFGGLATAATSPLPEFTAGESVIGAELEMTAQSAELFDEVGPFNGTLTAGQQLLVVTMQVTNRSTQPRAADSALGASLREVRLEGMPDTAPQVIRADDHSFSPLLQPDVPVPLLLAWPVKADAVGAAATVVLHTATPVQGRIDPTATFWTSIKAAARVNVPVTVGEAP